MSTEYEAIYKMLTDIKNLGASDELVKQVFTTVASLQSQNERMKEALERR